MEQLKMKDGSLVHVGIRELQDVRGGVSVACFRDLWGYIEKAFAFIKEYHKEIINGLKRGWNNF